MAVSGDRIGVGAVLRNRLGIRRGFIALRGILSERRVFVARHICRWPRPTRPEIKPVRRLGRLEGRIGRPNDLAGGCVLPPRDHAGRHLAFGRDALEAVAQVGRQDAFGRQSVVARRRRSLRRAVFTRRRGVRRPGVACPRVFLDRLAAVRDRIDIHGGLVLARARPIPAEFHPGIGVQRAIRRIGRRDDVAGARVAPPIDDLHHHPALGQLAAEAQSQVARGKVNLRRRAVGGRQQLHTYLVTDVGAQRRSRLRRQEILVVIHRYLSLRSSRGGLRGPPGSGFSGPGRKSVRWR